MLTTRGGYCPLEGGGGGDVDHQRGLLSIGRGRGGGDVDHQRGLLSIGRGRGVMLTTRGGYCPLEGGGGGVMLTTRGVCSFLLKIQFIFEEKINGVW